MLYTAAYGNLPITLKVAKSHLKVDDNVKVDDALITGMLNDVLFYAESETGRSYRANTWTLLIDAFEDRICLRRSPINTITSVKYLVSGSFSTIAASVYYLKKGRQFSELLLSDDQSWPTDLDTIEHGIEIIFLTGIDKEIARAKNAMLKHLANLYQNRGDFNVSDSAKQSGAKALYDQPGMKIVRV